MASQHCVFSSDLQEKFSVKTLPHTGDIYMASPDCVLPDELQN